MHESDGREELLPFSLHDETRLEGPAEWTASRLPSDGLSTTGTDRELHISTIILSAYRGRLRLLKPGGTKSPRQRLV